MRTETCKTCLKVFTFVRNRPRKFCSKSCFHAGSRTKKLVCCAQCDVLFLAPPSKQRKYCSRKCKEVHMSADGAGPKPAHCRDGRHQYRTRAFKTHGALCVICGYNEDERMLDVDHIDGDRTNNKIENLQPLCVWHHAAKTRGVIQPGMPNG